MKTIKRITGILLLVLLVAVGSFGALLWSGIIWRSPAYYEPATRRVLEVPIMDMKAYDSLGDHARPYIYQVQGKGGSVYILGIEHTRDPKDAQLDSIRRIFESYQPDIAFVEGRLGFLFSGLQEPVTEHGEGGLTVQLAKKKGYSLLHLGARKECRDPDDAGNLYPQTTGAILFPPPLFQ